MFKISLMDYSNLEEAYKIELETNPAPWSKDNFFSSFEVGHNSIVCKKDHKIIGFLIFSLIKNESHLLNIAVLEKWQRKGSGKMLMNAFIKQSQVLGARKIFLEVRSKNQKALFFYKKYKFIEDALRVDYYSGDNPDDAILMSLEI